MFDNPSSNNGDSIVDVQMRTDERRLKIDQVGVKKIRYPIDVKDRENGSQRTVASVNMYVDLPHNHKGTHMSRFIEILAQHRNSISTTTIPSILADMKDRLRAKSAHLELTFPFFISKSAPVTGAVALMEYGCVLTGSQGEDDVADLTVSVIVPVTTLCPCSKEISSYGAHNQRGLVTVTVRYAHFFWMEDLIRLVESSASSGVYSLLKRTDEKFVTETAYENPRFVEDVVREVAVRLKADSNFTWFSVAAENFESIHNHSAYAFLEYTRPREGEEDEMEIPPEKSGLPT
ncbi:MAG: GTP cyclohydrolase FolE2 [Deltaproteobacteria bacterium]|jgi:GTP cyclohydrolase I|nr:GTP cyclohydrolase FolE2 [Deltaproteobacteria bacterium]